MELSGFTLGVLVLGGGTLAALVGWNAWLTRRNTPRQPDTVPAAAGGGDADPDAVHGGPSERREPVFEPEHEHLVPPAAPERRPGLDPLIDSIAPIAVDSPVSGDAAIAALPSTRRAGGKPFAVEGLHEASAAWEPARPGQRYGAFQAGVQLANRAGALNEIEFSEFVVKAQAFADAIGGTPEFPEMRDEVARARELDQFAGGHDAQLSLTLRARHAAWSPGYVQQQSARLGFVAGVVPGRLVLPSPEAGAPPILVLSFDTQAALADDPTQAALREVILSVDVPQVPRGEQPFVRMREAAAALAEAMDGVLTDDNGQVIQSEALDAIGADLEALYEILESRDLAAGSPQARRLFS